jgi:hypothetical protein
MILGRFQAKLLPESDNEFINFPFRQVRPLTVGQVLLQDSLDGRNREVPGFQDLVRHAGQELDVVLVQIAAGLK